MAEEKKCEEPVWSELGTRDKARYLFKNITVEPMLACYIIPSVLASLATQNLNLEKACRVNLRYSDEVCTALERRETANYTHEEVQVQQLVAGMSIWKTLLQSSVPALLIMFLGSWSDRRRRRKPCMLMPIVGEFLTSIGLLLCTYFFYQLPMEFAGVAEALFPAVTGGWMTMFMAIFSYIGDVTTLETRTLRIGLVNVFCSVGIPIGTALSGVLYHQIGYYGVFSLAASIYVFSFAYGYLRIKEEPRPSVQYVFPPSDAQNDKDKWVIREKPAADCKPGDDSEKSGKIFGFLRDFFDLQHIRDTMEVAFKEGSNNRRKRVVLLMVVVMVVIGPLHGEMTVMYLFTRYRFNWNEVDYSIFSTYSMVTNLIGTLVSVGVFSHMLKIDDALIGVMSCMSKILAGFVYAYAKTNWQIYLAPLVDIVNGTSFIAMRSIASKLVPPEELGKINSLFGVCEALMPLVYGPMYSAVYAATMDTMPGAFFLLGGALTMPAVLIFAWMYTEHRRDKALLEQVTLSQLGSKAKPLSKKEEALRHFRCDAIATTPSSLDTFVSCPEYSEKVAADNATVAPRPSAETVASANESVAPSAETVAAANAPVVEGAETVAAANESVAPSAQKVAAPPNAIAASLPRSVPETERGVDNPAFQPDEEVSG